MVAVNHFFVQEKFQIVSFEHILNNRLNKNICLIVSLVHDYLYCLEVV